MAVSMTLATMTRENRYRNVILTDVECQFCNSDINTKEKSCSKYNNTYILKYPLRTVSVKDILVSAFFSSFYNATLDLDTNRSDHTVSVF